jgi:hypothetical protein
VAQTLYPVRESQPAAPLEILSSGVDWITTTTKDHSKQYFVRTLAELWLCKQQEAGYERVDFAWNGYIGWRTEGISYGDRDDGTLVRLSGQQARLHGDVLSGRCDHVSRVDFQVTLKEPNEAKDWAEAAADTVSGDARVSSGQTAMAVISSNRSRSTLYLGRRISDRFYRVYDKHAESKGEWPAGSWRFEVEFKGRRAEHYGALLAQCRGVSEWSRSVVAHTFQDYGFTLPSDAIPRLWFDKTPRRQTTDEGRLRYLGTCVRPMVQKLREAYGTETIIKLLDLNDDGGEMNVE